jgi:hypothetical protein
MMRLRCILADSAAYTCQRFLTRFNKTRVVQRTGATEAKEEEVETKGGIELSRQSLGGRETMSLCLSSSS